MKACFMGLGYIGLPTAIIAAKHGVEIAGVDINAQVVEVTNQGKLHIIEPGMEEMLREVLASGHFKAYTEPRVSDAYFMVVPTPFKGDHEPDVSFVESATRMVLPLLKEGDLYVIESTSPVGTTERMARLIFSERPELEGKIYIAYCPERVLPGRILYELEHNDRIIGSSDPRAAQMTKELYETFVKEGHCLTCDDVTAEMCKLVENTYRDINIAFANQLSEICAVAGIDVHELIALANRHPRVNILSPGLGVGGHCLAVDPWFLVERYQEDASLIHEARVINDGKPRWVMEQMEKQLKGDHSEKIGILGMAYKPDIDDMRESPSLHLAHLLQEKGYAVYGCEPNSTADTLEGIPLLSLDECLDVCDHVVIALGHREFLSPQARAKILSVPHYDCIGFEQGEKR